MLHSYTAVAKGNGAKCFILNSTVVNYKNEAQITLSGEDCVDVVSGWFQSRAEEVYHQLIIMFVTVDTSIHHHIYHQHHHHLHHHHHHHHHHHDHRHLGSASVT